MIITLLGFMSSPENLIFCFIFIFLEVIIILFLLDTVSSFMITTLQLSGITAPVIIFTHSFFFILPLKGIPANEVPTTLKILLFFVSFIFKA